MLETHILPYQLREYLQLYYTSVFWVGARYSDPDWVWLNGNKMVEDDWRSGMPSKHPSKLCLFGLLEQPQGRPPLLWRKVLFHM
ncbi:C-type lectin fold [Trinorchestia longiramus]|nr:C-type lectin fold [Trinorchestia longiramus]